METQATPRPWKITRTEGSLGVGLDWAITGRWTAIATLFDEDDDPEQEANAALIVRAVNNHDALVEALEALLAAVPEKPYWLKPDAESEGYFEVNLPEPVVEQARAALAQIAAPAKEE